MKTLEFWNAMKEASKTCSIISPELGSAIADLESWIFSRFHYDMDPSTVTTVINYDDVAAISDLIERVNAICDFDSTVMLIEATSIGDVRNARDAIVNLQMTIDCIERWKEVIKVMQDVALPSLTEKMVEAIKNNLIKNLEKCRMALLYIKSKIEDEADKQESSTQDIFDSFFGKEGNE